MDLGDLAQRQDGVVARRQVLAAGGSDNDIERLVRRRVWARLHPGVYVDHTGPPSWEQLAWAAVLFHWPAALCRESVVHPGRLPIHVMVAAHRSRVRLPGVVLHRSRGLEYRVRWNAGPPRQRLEHAVIDLAAAATDRWSALAVIAEVVRERRTTVDRLREVLVGRARVRHRAWLLRVLDDVALGACSALEHAYLTGVERAHGLPRGTRQAAAVGRWGRQWRDVDHPRYGLVVELDGRLFHDPVTARDADLDRDLDAAALDDRRTVRLGWGQVVGRPCDTAARLEVLLRRGGWTGSARRCGPGCTLRVGSPAPGAGDPTPSRRNAGQSAP